MKYFESGMIGFATKHNYKEMKKYYKTKFFEDFLFVLNNHSVKYAEMFYKNLNPSFVLNHSVK